VHVEAGLLAAKAERVNEVFLWSERTGLPFVCLKAGVSLDGRIALPSGESKWITGEASRKAVQRLRAEMGAVLVGPRTACLDNPALLPRLRGAPEVVRVVLDPRGDLPSSLQVFDGRARTIHVVPKGAPCHAERLELEATSDTAGLLAEIKRRGVRGLLVEGGAQTHALFLPFARRIELFVSGVALGAGPAWLGDYGIAHLSEALRFKVDRMTRMGEDVRLSLRP
jgi:diaminohydroxyphosphoribosylaminopyrimidine deaminase/5-amino-6-(5-phosphoribosylamino)uracil reductase